MMDQQSFEATRPVSADPAVALAEALGQLPKVTVKAPLKPSAAKPQIVAKTTVEELAGEHGLRLGDQNGLTIRRVKRGKGYSFIRANGTQIRHAGTIRRLHSMAVPPAYADVRYAADPASHLQAVGRDDVVFIEVHISVGRESPQELGDQSILHKKSPFTRRARRIFAGGR